MKGRWLPPSGARAALPVGRLIGQRNGGPEHVGRIVKPLGLDQPFGVATVAFRSAIPLTPRKKVGVPARKCHRIESPACGLRPLPVSLLLEAVRSIGEASKNLDQHMIAAKAEGGGLHGNARRGAPECVSNDRAARRNRLAIAWIIASTLRLSIDRSQFVSMNTRCPLTICGRTCPTDPAGHGAHGGYKHRPEFVKRRDVRLPLFRRTAPGRRDHDHGVPSGPMRMPSWTVSSSGADAAIAAHPTSTFLASANGNSSMPDQMLGSSCRR